MWDVVHGQTPNKTLRLIGYWADVGREEWPDPALLVRTNPDTASQQRVLDYLRGGTVYVAAAGPSFCRLCGVSNGSVELTDGEHFVWPEGLAHYIAEHDVRLPDAVTVLMEQPPAPVDVEAFEDGLLRTRQITIDSYWWRSLRNLH